MTFLLVLLLSVTILSVFGACPDGYLPVTDSNTCYKPYLVPTTWYEAELKCFKANGHLASANDAFFNSKLIQLAQAQFSRSSDFWLDGISNWHNSKWGWSDFSNFSYINWQIGKIELWNWKE